MIEDGRFGGSIETKHLTNVSANSSKVVLLHFLFLFLFTQFLINLTDVLNELDDSFEVIVVDAIFNLVFMFEGIEMSEERFEEL